MLAGLDLALRRRHGPGLLDADDLMRGGGPGVATLALPDGETNVAELLLPTYDN
jgi:hypothetical protein